MTTVGTQVIDCVHGAVQCLISLWERLLRQTSKLPITFTTSWDRPRQVLMP